MSTITINEKTTAYQITEAFRTIRTNLRFCGREKKVIAVTSCVPNEGKSSVSMRLAQALTEDGSSVILVDADLRKSVMRRRFTLREHCRGLSDYLSGYCSVKEAVQKTDVNKFDVILSGVVPPNPTELLRTKRFREMLVELREQYDYVLIDTPPVGIVIDAAVIAESSDGILWVISSGQIRRRLAVAAREQIEKSGCPVLGAVLNKVDTRKTPGGGMYYGDGYYGGRYYEKQDGHSDAVRLWRRKECRE